MYSLSININYPYHLVGFTVVFTANEPLMGWFNNLYGPLGFMAGSLMGIIKGLHCNADCIADILPVDMAVNSAIAVAWDLAQNM
jgi:fatty acyl-CoA reductase